MSKKEEAFPKPCYHPLARLLIKVAGSPYMRFALGIRQVRRFNNEIASDQINRFKEGQTRLILAFRHTAVEDAPLVLMGVKQSHIAFLYGRDVLNWAGAVTKILFPRLGFIAVQNRATNREGMHYLRHSAKEGRFPLALAPEGQVTYHAHRTAPIEAGVANLALWAEQEGKEVIILPVAIAYRYAKETNALVTNLLERWYEESEVQSMQGSLIEQLAYACEACLKLVASWWEVPLGTEGSFVERRDELCSTLLAHGERLAELPPLDASILDRLFRLRFKGEDTLFTVEASSLAPLQRSKLEARQQIAHIYLRINQCVDVLEYLDPSYITENPTPSRMAEVALTLLDVLNRLRGGTINTRYSPKGKEGGLYFGNPITVGDPTLAGSGRKERLTLIERAVHAGLVEASDALEERWTSHFT
ncbi:MAG: hypothetical protein WC233_07220 [Sphaerochaeta sp.]